jgi:acyl carrier protein
MSEAKEKIKTFITNSFLFGDAEGLEDHSSFIEEGLIDSTGILELIEYISSEFSITVENDELIPENLDSINNLLAFIARKSGQAQAV